MLAEILTTRWHVRIELEGLKMDLCAHLAIQAFQRFFQSAKTDCAPRAGNVGDKIDSHRCRHTLSVFQ